MFLPAGFTHTVTFVDSFKGRVRDPRASFSWRSAEKGPVPASWAGSGHLGHNHRDDCGGSQKDQRQVGVVPVCGVRADLPTAAKGLEGGEIPTAADGRSACPRRATGRGDRDGWLTLAASGRFPGGGTRSAVSES